MNRLMRYLHRDYHSVKEMQEITNSKTEEHSVLGDEIHILRENQYIQTLHEDGVCPAPFVHNAAAWENFKRRLIMAEQRYSYDNTVDNMIKNAITTPENMGYWEKALDGREPLNKDFVRAVLDRYAAKVRGV